MEHIVICIGRQYGNGGREIGAAFYSGSEVIYNAEKAASERIYKIDKMRQRYFNVYSETGWGKAESYNLLLSDSRFGVENCADLIISAISMTEGGVSHE